MINTGIIRKIDNLGRIVLPKELRYGLNIESGDDFQILVDNNNIILSKYSKTSAYEDKIINLLNVFNSNIQYNILLIIKNISLPNYEVVNNELLNIIKDRKKYYNLSSIKIDNELTINNCSLLYPIVFESNLIATIIAYGSGNIREIEVDCNILKDLIVNIIVEK